MSSQLVTQLIIIEAVLMVTDPTRLVSDPTRFIKDPVRIKPDPVRKGCDRFGRVKSGCGVIGSDPDYEGPDPVTSRVDPVDVKLGFSIRRLGGGCDSVAGTGDSVVVPAAGTCGWRFALFAKLRKPSLNFKEPNDIKGNVETSSTNLDGGNVVGPNSRGFECRNEILGEDVKKHPNLIGANLIREESLQFEENEVNEKKRADLEVVEQAVLDVRNDPCDEILVKLLKLTHGYESFRDGQLEAIKLILDGQTSMVILPTGAGNSLCSQLPALVLQGMTLVISPLVALMFDQLKQLPPVIPGGLLCSSQTLEESSETLAGTRRILKVCILGSFVSPERLLNAEFTSIFSATLLVVIDEAHCISEWSHNFRPSYMMLRATLLRASLGVECSCNDCNCND